MEEKIRKFIEEVTELPSISAQNIKLIKKAKDLLEEDFKDNVIELWRYYVFGYDAEKFKELLEKHDIVEFIAFCRYSDKQKEFITNHLNRINDIIQTLLDCYNDKKEK